MTELLYEMRDPGPVEAPYLPGVAQRLVEAVRANGAPGMLPAVERVGPDGVLMPGWELAGESDARTLAHALAEPRFVPFVELLQRLETWCERMAERHASVLAPGVLDLDNAELFGPMVSEAFVACAAGRPGYAKRFVVEQGARHEEFLTLFLDRLQADLLDVWPADPRLRGPVVGIWAHGEETHNGRQRVLRLEMSGGGHVAYKPRPAGGEALFLDRGDSEIPGSVFALLNELPAASGEIRLPVLSCWTGRGADRDGYGWHEWIEPPDQWGALRRSGSWTLRGPRLNPSQAERFWHRAGALGAACFAFGIADLSGGNLVVGADRDDADPLLYPVDLEVYFCRTGRLYDTGLIHDAAHSSHHHVGLENRARWCTADGPATYWRRTHDGRRQLVRRTQPFGRQQTRSVVGDTSGRVGYGPYLTAMLRGMFDAWTLLCRQRGRIREFLATRLERHYVRVVRRPTVDYLEPLMLRWCSAGGAAPRSSDSSVRFDRAELDQLRRMDVPYFLRRADGGPLLCLEPPPSRFRPVRVPMPRTRGSHWPPVSDLLIGANLELSALAVALRDAVEYAFDDLPDARLVDVARGVRLCVHGPTQGEVAFDWTQVGRRIVYSWEGTKVRLWIETLDSGVAEPAAADPAAPGQPVPAPADGAASTSGIRERLLRLDRVDAALRVPWAEGGFVDAGTAQRLRTLTDAGIAWLRQVVAEHGWPGQALVGADAEAAASRLLQHTDEHLEFRRHCLRLMRRAAETGAASWREVAYLTDALRLDEGLPQRYGTKFQQESGSLVPCPLQEPELVDELRAQLGLEPLREYAEQLRSRFPLPSTEER